jgi:hypothetical protein
MYHHHLFQIVMREREREILEEVRRSRYHARRRRERCGMSTHTAGRLRSTFSRIKAIIGSRWSRQQTIDGNGGYRL